MLRTIEIAPGNGLPQKSPMVSCFKTSRSKEPVSILLLDRRRLRRLPGTCASNLENRDYEAFG
jgi:hypothetical protein